jgi:hypothetical protein
VLRQILWLLEHLHGRRIVSLQVILNVAILLGTCVLSFVVAYKYTPDLDNVQHKFSYRLAFACFTWRALTFLCEGVGILVRLSDGFIH